MWRPKSVCQKGIPSFAISSHPMASVLSPFLQGLGNTRVWALRTQRIETEQPAETKLHPIQRPEFQAKGRASQTTSMRTQSNRLNVFTFSVLLSLFCLSGSVFAQGPL